MRLENTKAKKILILGVGNILLRDEGLGVRVVERIMKEYPLPENVEIIDGGTLGLRLIPYLEGRDAIFIVDAVDLGREPGELFRIEFHDIDDIYNERKLSAHQVGLRDILALSRFQQILPQKVLLFGIQPKTVDIGLDLSEPVSSRLDELIKMLLDEVQGLASTY